MVVGRSWPPVQLGHWSAKQRRLVLRLRRRQRHRSPYAPAVAPAVAARSAAVAAAIAAVATTRGGDGCAHFDGQRQCR